MSNAYPLTWPPAWPRTPGHQRQHSNFKATVPSALKFLEDEIRRLGAKSLVVSSNCTLGSYRPTDPGVCAYFHYQGIEAAIPCDRWSKVEDNVHAIAKTIESMRGIERWGAKHMIKAAFSGFAALPAPGQSSAPWRQVLGYVPGEKPALQDLETRYQKKRSEHHPDKGGTPEMFHAVQTAYEQAKGELRG